jgi:hypothetical protein
VAGLSLVWAGLSYIFSADERREDAENRRKATHYQAWQVINSARGSTGDGGRVAAIHDLYQNSQSLNGIDLRHAHLGELRIPRADLRKALLDSAIIYIKNGRNLKANFVRGHGASISGDLVGADFFEAELTGSFLSGEFCQVNFIRADLRGARISADLRGTSFEGADLRGVSMDIVNDDYKLPNLQYVDFRGANVFGLHIPRGTPGPLAPPIDLDKLDSLLVSRAIAGGAVSIEDSSWRSRSAPLGAAKPGLLSDSPTCDVPG